MFARPKPLIRFTCAPEDKGVIAEPVPAKTHMPDWFRKLPAFDREQRSVTDTGLTVKRCMPFLDAMTTGWILPLAASVRLDIRDEGRTVEAGWEFDKPMISNHGSHQVAGHPSEPRPPCKFHNYWSVRTPKGWSCLFVPPLNRPSKLFEVVAGVVDTDTYTAHIHFPFFATGEDGLHVLEKGTPLVQVIPFRREATAIDCEIAAETPLEMADRKVVHRNTLTGEGWYRRFARAAR
ncbi:DUF6065 family protein [Methylobrevis pamukkalensis]|uniref:Uncharacterized protein n=1 Tax=Methylobrevis pamukkalensis TaxID=1439726 RepID=A0A1E3GWU1_9HYPH|nr:DUF6065 family protein [Methylobrevis pamukkalensis]ODN67821.1 hypothetical protein A6302_04363 [Methylobrevis pamukkalensis]